MTYKYSKGAQVIGDLKAADDTERNTLIDFGEDIIDFQTSGSSVLKVSGSNVYLANGSDLHLAGNSRIYFDSDDVQTDVSVFERAGGDGLIIDGNDRVRFKADNYVIFEAPDSSEPILVDYNSNPDRLRLQMLLSSSQDISGSKLHLQEGMNIAGETIFNNQGNIVGTAATAVITIADNPTSGDTISFGDSTITPVVVSTYQTRATGDDITLGASAAQTRTNTKTKLESLHNVSITINGNDLEITNNNLGLIGNRTISETFTSVNNSVSGFTGGNNIDISANEITASSFSSPDGTLISAEGDFQGNNASFNEVTSSNLSFSGDLFLNNTEKLIDSQGDHALLQTMVVELSIPGTDVQTDSSAFRFFCPYDLTIDELQLNLDENNSGEAVTVQISGSEGFTQSLTLTGPTDNGTTGSLDGSLQAGELLNFEITSVTGTPQGLIANLLYRRTLS